MKEQVAMFECRAFLNFNMSSSEVDISSLHYFPTAQTLKMGPREHNLMIVIPFYLQLVNYIQAM